MGAIPRRRASCPSRKFAKFHTLVDLIVSLPFRCTTLVELFKVLQCCHCLLVNISTPCALCIQPSLRSASRFTFDCAARIAGRLLEVPEESVVFPSMNCSLRTLELNLMTPLFSLNSLAPRHPCKRILGLLKIYPYLIWLGSTTVTQICRRSSQLEVTIFSALRTISTAIHGPRFGREAMSQLSIK